MKDKKELRRFLYKKINQLAERDGMNAAEWSQTRKEWVDDILSRVELDTNGIRDRLVYENIGECYIMVPRDAKDRRYHVISWSNDTHGSGIIMAEVGTVDMLCDNTIPVSILFGTEEEIRKESREIFDGKLVKKSNYLSLSEISSKSLERMLNRIV